MSPTSTGGGGHRQRGAAALVFVLLVSMIAFFFVVGPLFFQSLKQIDQTEIREENYMDGIATQLQEWYWQNADAIDATPVFAITPAALWVATNVEAKPPLQVAFSSRLSGGQVQFRRIVVWLRRASPDSSSFNPVTGTFVPGTGVSWRLIDGEPIQGRKYEITQQRMQQFASMLQRRFQAKFESDPLRSLSINHFRPISGNCTTTTDDIPCIDAFAAVNGAANWNTLLTQDANTLRSAWGQPFTVSNLVDSDTTVPPFTMAIRSPLPWGGSILVKAIQPLN